MCLVILGASFCLLQVLWRPVVWGYAMQFIMAILVLRWEYGYIAVKFISDEIVKFVQFAFEGAAVVFGDPFLILHPFVFMVGVPKFSFKR